MPELSPFCGFLYDRELVPDIADVIAPPYDVVDDEQRRELLGRHPWNALHIDLGDPDEYGDRYSAACRRWDEWRARGIVRRDPTPRFYLYRMGYRDASGAARQTSGVIGALRLGEPGAGSGILPHERTLSKPFGDRLDLLRSCQVNTSPIWLLSTAPGLTAAFEPEGPPRAAVTDDNGVHHRLYDTTMGGRIATIAEAIDSAPLVIADGHHRFQTALAYRDEADANAAGAGALMAVVVELSPDELVVEPIHRVVRPQIALPTGTPVEGDLRAIAASKGAVVVANQVGRGLLMDPPPPDVPAVAHLHDVQLPALGIRNDQLDYDADDARVARSLRTGAVTVFYVPPVSVEEIAGCARRGDRFPEKTSFFTPKPRTGLVFRSLTES